MIVRKLFEIIERISSFCMGRIPLSYPLRQLKQRLTGREYILNGACRGCGQCCMSVNLKDRQGWIRSEKQFAKLCEHNPQYTRFYIIPGNGNEYLQFNCSLYDIRYGCKDYENRLEICRKYPHKSLILHGGHLVEGCGYTINSVRPFKKYLAQELKKKPCK